MLIRRTPEQAALLSRGMAGPLTPVERVLDIVSLLAVVLSWLLPLVNFSSLPAEVPTHFGVNGEPDAYGGRLSVFQLAAVASAAWVLVLLTRRRGSFTRLPVALTEENHLWVGTLTRQFLTAVGTAVVIMFAGLQLQTLRVAMGTARGAGPVFGVVMIAVVLALGVAYMVAANRAPPPGFRGRADGR